MGRIGEWFASSRLGLEPDLITVAKGLTSAYVPLSACLVSERVWRTLVEGGDGSAFSHGYTYSSHPLTAAAALANLDIMENEQLLSRSSANGAYLQSRLREALAEQRLVADVRGRDMIAAIEFANTNGKPVPFDPELKVGPRIAAACQERGVLIRALPAADTISFAPPLIISPAEIDELVEHVRDAVDEVAGEVFGARQR